MTARGSTSTASQVGTATLVLGNGRWLLLAVVVLGVGLRLGYLSLNPSLWSDEAAVFRNLQSRSFAGLTQPLADNQHAPLLFLFAEKLLYTLAGLQESVLRLPAAIASLLAVGLFAVAAPRAVGRTAGIIAVALLALSPSLIRYTGELKPYAVDVLACVATLMIAQWVHRRDAGWPTIAMAAALGALLPWCSYTSVFVLCGTGGVLILDRLLVGDRPGAWRLVVMCGVWATSFLVEYGLIARHSLESDYLLAFWDYAFVPFPPHSVWDVRRMLSILVSPFVNPLGLESAGLGAIFFIIGLAAMFRRDRLLAGFCVAPIALAFGAGIAHVYPFAARLILFTIPLLTLPLAEGIRVVAGPLGAWAHVAIVFIVLSTPVVAINELFDQPQISGIRELLPAVAGRLQDGDQVYVYYHSELPFDVYRDRLGSRPVTVLIGQDVVREPDKLRNDLGRMRTGRVWLIFSEVQKFFGDEEQAVLAQVAIRGVELDKIDLPGARAHLFEIR